MDELSRRTVLTGAACTLGAAMLATIAPAGAQAEAPRSAWHDGHWRPNPVLVSAIGHEGDEMPIGKGVHYGRLSKDGTREDHIRIYLTYVGQGQLDVAVRGLAFYDKWHDVYNVDQRLGWWNVHRHDDSRRWEWWPTEESTRWLHDLRRASLHRIELDGDDIISTTQVDAPYIVLFNEQGVGAPIGYRNLIRCADIPGWPPPGRDEKLAALALAYSADFSKVRP
jgi:hypothetical protein